MECFDFSVVSPAFDRIFGSSGRDPVGSLDVVSPVSYDVVDCPMAGLGVCF